MNEYPHQNQYPQNAIQPEPGKSVKPAAQRRKRPHPARRARRIGGAASVGTMLLMTGYMSFNAASGTSTAAAQTTAATTAATTATTTAATTATTTATTVKATTPATAAQTTTKTS